eukprot:6052789-Heterocapsa_arctica.AAC.1
MFLSEPGVGEEVLVVFRVKSPWVDVVNGVGVSVGVVGIPVLVGDGLAVVGAVYECGGGFNSEDLAFVRDISPGHHGSSEGNPFHGKDLGVGVLCDSPKVVEFVNDIAGVVFHGGLDNASSHV